MSEISPMAEILNVTEGISDGAIRRLDNAMGQTLVPMIHPKTGVQVNCISETQQIMRNLVKGFVLILRESDNLCARLEIDKNLEPFEIIKKRREADERQRVHGEGENTECQCSRQDGAEGDHTCGNCEGEQRGSEVSNLDSTGGLGESKSPTGVGTQSKRRNRTKK